MPRYSILAHNHPSPHWDLFLESGTVLRAWRLLEPLGPGVAVPAEAIGDHRPLYLDYEGPVSGNRGTVTRVDAGTFSWEVDSGERLAVRLAGNRFAGRVTFSHEAGVWSCRFDPD